MRMWVFNLIAPAALAAAQAGAAEMALLEAKADTVRVAVAPPADGYEYVHLPALEFKLTIKTSCPAETSPESLSVSLADTRQRFAANEIEGIVETSLILPRRQSVHLRIEDFCEDGEGLGDSRSRLVTDLVTARLSLRCAGGDNQSIVYATLPLDVELQCEIDDDEPVAQEDPSAESDASR